MSTFLLQMHSMLKFTCYEFSSSHPQDFHSFLSITHSTTIQVTATRAPQNHLLCSCLYILQNISIQTILGLWHKIIDSQRAWSNTEIPPEAILKQFCWEGADHKQKHTEPGKHKGCNVCCAMMVPVLWYKLTQTVSWEHHQRINKL